MSNPLLTDAEVVCAFMEKCPPNDLPRHHYRDFKWWIRRAGSERFEPVTLTLDALHEVEARLSDEQWARYGEIHFLRAESLCGCRDDFRKGMLHATAAQKIRALATILRGLQPAEPKVLAEGSSLQRKALSPDQREAKKEFQS